MAARERQIEDLLDSQSVGESHTGLLVIRGSLSATQQAAEDAENADRAELYRLESAKESTPSAQVALIYYIVRLEYVSKGTWVDATTSPRIAGNGSSGTVESRSPTASLVQK